MEEGGGTQRAKLEIADVNRILSHISILLDHLQRQADSRLRDRFPLSDHDKNALWVSTYPEFLSELT